MPPQLPAQVKESQIEVVWIYPGVLPEIPFPATERFANLLRSLEPYRPNVRGINVEAPTGKLSEVAVRFGLLDGEIVLSFAYDGFSIRSFAFKDTHRSQFGIIAGIALANVQPEGRLPIAGRYQLRYQGHWQIPEGDGRQYLQQMAATPSPEMACDGVAFTFKVPAPQPGGTGRLLLENSLRVTSGLFCECSVEFPSALEVSFLTQIALESISHAIALTGITLR